jgi:hypothetical protein
VADFQVPIARGSEYRLSYRNYPLSEGAQGLWSNEYSHTVNKAMNVSILTRRCVYKH